MGGASTIWLSPCASTGTTSRPARRNSQGSGRTPITSAARRKLFITSFSNWVPRRRVASFEHGVDLPEKKRGYLDLFWKGKLLVEQKSAGRSLVPARRQVLDYFPGLKEHELPRYILLSDFQNFELYDLGPDGVLYVPSESCTIMGLAIWSARLNLEKGFCITANQW